jgi:hypothetical protein
MHYVTRRSHGMQKHKLSVTCPSMLFMETAPGSHEHEKQFVVVYPRHTGMRYVSHRSHQMQEHKFSVLCPDMLFIETTRAHPSM